jgi:hypothetical protein
LEGEAVRSGRTKGEGNRGEYYGSALWKCMHYENRIMNYENRIMKLIKIVKKVGATNE